MASSAYTTLEGMVVNTKAAAVYAAFERSLLLGGMLVPTLSVPAGSFTAQVPFIDGTINVQNAGPASDFAAGDDITSSNVDAAPRLIQAKTWAARTVLRDIGGINPVEVGTLLGQKVSSAYDAASVATLVAGAADSVSTGGAFNMSNLFEAASKIRAAGETGALYGIVSPAMAYQLLSSMTTNGNIAGGDFQTEALRTGWVGSFAGIMLFQSSHATADGIVMGADYARQAIFKGLDLEIARSPRSIGNDVVASLHAAVGIVDGNRGVTLTVA